MAIYLNGKSISTNESSSIINLKNQDHHVYVDFGLPGGKGGFGSMLRAIGAQIEKTTNKEACRDLNGRRLRDVNAEKRIKNWVQKQAEQKREEEQRKKEKLERLRSEPKVMFNDPEYLKEREQIPVKIEDAVKYSMNKKKSATVTSAQEQSSTVTCSSSATSSSQQLVDSSNSKVSIATLESKQDVDGALSSSSKDASELKEEQLDKKDAQTLIGKLNLKRKAAESVVIASRKKKTALWLGDDLSDDDEEDEEEDDNTRKHKQTSLI